MTTLPIPQAEQAVTPATHEAFPAKVSEPLSVGGKLGGLLFILVFGLLGSMILGELVLTLFRR